MSAAQPGRGLAVAGGDGRQQACVGVLVGVAAELAPEDVAIVVFTPARQDLIERTVASVRGITNPVVIHMYTATAPTWRNVVLGHDGDTLRKLILGGAQDVL